MTDDRPAPDPARRTIDPASEVDEASLESFPASDPPGYSGGAATPSDYAGQAQTSTPEDPDAPDDASSAPPDAVGG